MTRIRPPTLSSSGRHYVYHHPPSSNLQRLLRQCRRSVPVFVVLYSALLFMVGWVSHDAFSNNDNESSSLMFRALKDSSSTVAGEAGEAATVGTTPRTKDGHDVTGTTRTVVSSNSNDGWRPVHVFYGQQDETPATKGKTWFAQVRQDEIILDLLGNNGYFIDLAANDAVEWSNTIALERQGNWSGLCIEPSPKYWYDLTSQRRCTVVGALVGADDHRNNTLSLRQNRTLVDVKFRGVFGGIVGKMDDKLADRKREPKALTESRYTVSFREVLHRFHAPSTIDYLSLDVEGAEYLVMKDFPFDQYMIRALTVERPGDELRQLLESKGYIFLKDLAWWGETLWAHQSVYVGNDDKLTPNHPKIAAIVTEGK